MSSELGLTDRVHFLGWRRDMRPIYADLDVVVLSSLNEGSPVAVIEALAAARPVVATTVGGVGEVVDNGTSGILVHPRDAQAIAAGFFDSSTIRPGREALACRPIVRYPEVHGGPVVGDMETLYLDLAERRGLQRDALSRASRQ